MHLFPDTGNGVDVNPFGISGGAHIVEMVVHAVSAGTRLLIRAWQFSYIAPVVIAQQQGNVVRNTHSFVIIVLHFFIKRPYLWRFIGLFACHFLNDFALVFHYILQ